MKKSKKLFAVVSVILIAVMFFGCSGGKQEKATEEEVPEEYTLALKVAQYFADQSTPSYAKLYEDLTTIDHFSPEAAQYAVDHVEADWNFNAYIVARNYTPTMEELGRSTSCYDFLVNYSLFTPEQAQYAIDHIK